MLDTQKPPAAAPAVLPPITVTILHSSLLVMNARNTRGELYQPEAYCECGGFLVQVDLVWRHLDVCRECTDTARAGCPDDRAGHVHCNNPSPRICAHPGCSAPGDLTTWPCQRDHDDCCGCCNEES